MTSQSIETTTIARPNGVVTGDRDTRTLIETIQTSGLEAIVLDRRVSVFVPATVDVNVPADTELHVGQTMQFMAELFGGVSAVEQAGLYVSSRWGTVREKTVAVRSYTTAATLRRQFPPLLCFVRQLQKELRQEAIAVELDGRLLLMQFRPH